MKKELIKSTFEFLELIKNKKIVLFGAGPTCEELLNNLRLKCAYIVDNDPDLWEKTLHNLEIKNPLQLKDENFLDIVVIVASTDINDIIIQLQKYGLELGSQIHISPFLSFDQSVDKNYYPNLLVSSCTDGGGLFEINPNTSELKKVYNGNCRGLAQSNGKYYVVEEHSGFLILDNNYKKIDKIKTPENYNLHGITIDDSKGIFYANETKFDRLGIYDIENLKNIDQIDLKKGTSKIFDQHHFNDIHFYNGKLYASCFSINGVWQHGIWNDGGVVIIDPISKEIEKIALSDLNQPHSIYTKDNKIFYCNSRECNVFVGDKLLSQFNGYTRGLKSWKHFFFIGQSRARRLSTFTDRFTNISLDTGIHIWNSIEKTSSFVKIPAEQVFDIIIIGD